MEALEVVKCKLIILENVVALMGKPKVKKSKSSTSENMLDPMSNSDAVNMHLNEAGFVFVHAIWGSDRVVHIPQRHPRLWMAALCVNGIHNMNIRPVFPPLQSWSNYFPIRNRNFRSHSERYNARCVMCRCPSHRVRGKPIKSNIKKRHLGCPNTII